MGTLKPLPGAKIGFSSEGRHSRVSRTVFNNDCLPAHRAGDVWLYACTVLGRFCRDTATRQASRKRRSDPTAALVSSGALHRLCHNSALRAREWFDVEKLAGYHAGLSHDLVVHRNWIAFIESQLTKSGGVDRINDFLGSDASTTETCTKTQNKGQAFMDAAKELKKKSKAGQPVNATATLYSMMFGAICVFIEDLLTNCLRPGFNFTSLGGTSLSEARIKIGGRMSQLDNVLNTDVTSMDTSHFPEEVTVFMREILNWAGAIAGFRKLGDVFAEIVTGTQASWQTKSMPGGGVKFTCSAEWILASGWRWTLLLNSLRTWLDFLAQYDRTPNWALVQGDDGSFEGSGAANPLYTRLTQITFTDSTAVGYSDFCNHFFLPDTLIVTPNIPRLLFKFLAAPMPNERLEFAKRVLEVRTALTDLVPCCELRKKISGNANARFNPCLTEDTHDILYDIAVGLTRCSTDFWWRLTKPRIVLDSLHSAGGHLIPL